MADQVNVDDFIEHVGVKGMKWGQRKAEGGVTTGSGGAAGGSGKVSAEVKSARKAAYKAGQKDHLLKRRETMLKTHDDGSQSVSASKVAKTMLLDYGSLGVYSATKSAKLAGASDGKAVAIGMLGGPLGAQLYVNRTIKKKVNSAIN